jgi:hypothetical protein
MFSIRRDKQPRAKIAISILALLSQLPCFRSGMKLDTLQDPACFGRLESDVLSGWGVGIQMVLDNTHVLGMRVDVVDQAADTMSVVDLGAMLRHLHMAPAVAGSSSRNA